MQRIAEARLTDENTGDQFRAELIEIDTTYRWLIHHQDGESEWDEETYDSEPDATSDFVLAVWAESPQMEVALLEVRSAH